VSETPIAHDDGTLFAEPGGYDPATRQVYLPGPEVPPIPDAPTQRDLAQARDVLELVDAEFPFAGPADCANAIAELFTLVLRDAIAGRVPAFVHDAPVAGSGKSALALLHARLAVGDPGVFPDTSDPEEERKRLHALLLAGRRVLIADDCGRAGREPCFGHVHHGAHLD
jgi:hypothetical protein